jgi:hypothetical protein
MLFVFPRFLFLFVNTCVQTNYSSIKRNKINEKKIKSQIIFLAFPLLFSNKLQILLLRSCQEKKGAKKRNKKLIFY